MTPSKTHLVLIPSYNTGDKVYDTVRAARAQWAPVWVVVDGSTDGTGEGLLRMAEQDPQLRVRVLPHNHGKGAAVLANKQMAMVFRPGADGAELYGITTNGTKLRGKALPMIEGVHNTGTVKDGKNPAGPEALRAITMV